MSFKMYNVSLLLQYFILLLYFPMIKVRRSYLTGLWWFAKIVRLTVSARWCRSVYLSSLLREPLSPYYYTWQRHHLTPFYLLSQYLCHSSVSGLLPARYLDWPNVEGTIRQHPQILAYQVTNYPKELNNVITSRAITCPLYEN